MKFRLLLSIILVLCMNFAFGQGFGTIPMDDQNQVAGGLGLTWIDDQPYTTFTIAPDVSFGKIGVGLYFQLLMDNQNNFKFRSDEYKGGAGILRIIRYVRYGKKMDPVYVRVGSLEQAMLGHGFLVWNYNNVSNYDKRKIGMALDLDFKKAGFESFMSNFGKKELMGTRLYVRPVQFVNPDLFFLKNLRFGFTVVKDYNIPSWKVSGENEDVTAYGLDVDIPVINTDVVKSFLYFDYGKIQDFGSGKAVGINFMMPSFAGVFGLGASFERRWLGDRFLPNFFGPMYDLHRQLDPIGFPEDSPYSQLALAEKTTGYFGQLMGYITSKIRLIGNFQKLDDISHSGILHLEAQAPDLIPKFRLYAYYDKRNIETFKDARTLDINSLATVEVGYMLNPFIQVSTLYRWYWIENENGGYQPVERIEPRISFVYNF
ncbi:MAG: hypothetical protein Kow00108_04340 [Calditrichia bacterium]